ncbi:hypothetical protein vBAfQDWS535_38 [Alcaligenes phage vB_Af_QDWS535]|nr:hypothetical protein vBAfQDWS535_38 [Alcaligenes phage vB_Af_QDWS535]
MLNNNHLESLPWAALIREMEDQTNIILSSFAARVRQGEALENMLSQCFPEWYGTIDRSEENLRRFRGILRSMTAAYNRDRMVAPSQISLVRLLESMGPVLYMPSPEPVPAPPPEEAAVQFFTTTAPVNEMARRPRTRNPFGVRQNFPSSTARASWNSLVSQVVNILNPNNPEDMPSRRVVGSLLREPLTDELWDMFQAEVALRRQSGREESQPKMPVRFLDKDLEEIWQKLDILTRRKFSDFVSQTHAVYGNLGTQEVWPTEPEMFKYFIKQLPQKEPETV